MLHFSKGTTNITTKHTTHKSRKYNEILSDLYSLFDSESWYISLLSEESLKISERKRINTKNEVIC